MKTRVEMEDVEKRQHCMSIPTPSTFLPPYISVHHVCLKLFLQLLWEGIRKSSLSP